MQFVADQSVTPTTIGADLCAIFISLELSRSTWLVTSLSPGGGEKMSKHSVCAFQSSAGKRARGPEDPSQLSSFKKRGWTASGFTVSC
jgi:hypothetical protein